MAVCMELSEGGEEQETRPKIIDNEMNYISWYPPQRANNKFRKVLLSMAG